VDLFSVESGFFRSCRKRLELPGGSKGGAALRNVPEIKVAFHQKRIKRTWKPGLRRHAICPADRLDPGQLSDSGGPSNFLPQKYRRGVGNSSSTWQPWDWGPRKRHNMGPRKGPSRKNQAAPHRRGRARPDPCFDVDLANSASSAKPEAHAGSSKRKPLAAPNKKNCAIKTDRLRPADGSA